jgi:uncharacterized membrane protein (UPF0182 family)
MRMSPTRFDEPGDRQVIDWPPPRRGARRLRLAIAAIILILLFGSAGIVSYYVEALWFDSLGYASVFWTTLNLQAVTFLLFSVLSFALLQGASLALRPRELGDRFTTGAIMVNGRPLTLPLGSALRFVTLAVTLIISLIAGAAMMAEWPAFALYWHAAAAPAGITDPIFGRSVNFYLFSLPVLQLVIGWLTALAVVTFIGSIFYAGLAAGGSLVRRTSPALKLGGISAAFGALLLVWAARTYVSRFGRLFDDHTIFTGVTYTDAHVYISGLLIVAIALAGGALIAFGNAVRPRLAGLAVAAAPGIVAYVIVSVIAWYVTSFVVKPNELVREKPFIAHNIEFTREAFALTRITQHPFPADIGLDAVDVPNNRATLDNIRLWDWRALQDTLRQIQEIRTYYDFPDIDIDRYQIGGQTRQFMLATRELNVEKLPESSRNWINEKLIYTHGYGVTMNPVNGFTPEGLPQLVLSNMPVQSTIPEVQVARPEVYFGELSNTDVYVRTRQKEFNYPQGESNSLTVYEGRGGIVIGSFFRRLLIALDRGDLTKMPFSDDITAESRLLMRRNVRERVNAIAPFFSYDPDPYIVIGKDGRLYWLMDGFASSDTFPYARHYQVGTETVNYLRNSVKVVVDAYDGSVTFYIFDMQDPIVQTYRNVFPALFKEPGEMPDWVRQHVRYPEQLLKIQASVYGLYHMTDPEVFYNREDLWTVASEVVLSESRQQVTAPVEPNFIMMRLPGQSTIEFVEILPFTPSNRNNLIGWIAGRSDGAAYGTAFVYNFPKTRLIDGPLQIEARIDQNAQLSSQLSLWNQQGSHVRRGSLLVIPIGRALLYAEPIYLQAERSPMPELRLVVLALQDRLGYGPTFEAAMASLFGEGSRSGIATSATPTAAPAARVSGGAAPGVQDTARLIDEASRDLAEYQRLTAEGKLGEAGRKLEDLKRALDELNRARPR